MKFNFPAAMGLQGDKIFYTACVPFRVLKRLLAFDEGNVLDRSQRKVDAGRANAISKYLVRNQKTFVLPALTGILEDPEIEFEEMEGHPAVGVLSISMDANIKLFDGQHRATGIIDAASKDPELAQNTITIQLFVGMTLKQRQQAFSDINSKSKQVSASLNMSYNHRDESVQILQDCINNVKSWQGKIDHERNAVTSKSDLLFSLKHATEACRILLELKRNEKPSEKIVGDVGSWFNAVGPCVGWEKESNPIENSIALTAAGLMTLARVGAEIRKQKRTDQGCGCFYKAAQTIIEIDWNRSNVFWIGNLTDETGKMIGNANAQNEAAQKILALINKKFTQG